MPVPHYGDGGVGDGHDNIDDGAGVDSLTDANESFDVYFLNVCGDGDYDDGAGDEDDVDDVDYADDER